MVSMTYRYVGQYVMVSRSVWNNSTMVMQTQSCMYMVSLHKMEGTALGMAKNRIIEPIHAKCVLMIHIQHSRYRVIQPGIVICWAHGIGLGTVTPHLGWDKNPAP